MTLLQVLVTSTRRWSETIERGDAYAFVMPEHNHVEDGRIEPNGPMEDGAASVLDELHRMAGILEPARREPVG